MPNTLFRSGLLGETGAAAEEKLDKGARLSSEVMDKLRDAKMRLRNFREEISNS